jgi:hypothetical protein
MFRPTISDAAMRMTFEFPEVHSTPLMVEVAYLVSYASTSTVNLFVSEVHALPTNHTNPCQN